MLKKSFCHPELSSGSNNFYDFYAMLELKIAKRIGDLIQRDTLGDDDLFISRGDGR